jgi:hypothetical protein
MPRPNSENEFNIRVATHQDIDEIVNRCLWHWQDSPFRGVRADEKKIRSFILSLIHGGGLVLLSDTGIFVGQLTIPFMADETIASELLWTSFASGRKKIREEAALFEAYEYWARYIINATILHIGTYKGHKFLENRGYIKGETTYYKRIM